ncbi:ribonuclease J [bacterium (Candidatus Gribaldobacteria) CG07_land_8_20_14_0_80_33_18]|uniref:Ribonuclease J n=1 Tax=bacterium (Candidatus Gribaldobacteria) CG07_land_8_20_14_0_80_33_18 TaxID=2014272 RepID=A0A2M6Z3J2_9BACT|nr:MAG: ribonuclease J [bacterium (Candidatus Gribaldobacteria) CG10_big_fil_rev_8_21_14_0_10_33_41]PIU46887.1 MAG: ribonuclease J [bacterium (Candidatus Gribaldobacteria) CG07_land_8_20_14_0_80_33_18]PJA01134.1 MAG: ribonuclease J [bacterium (Candidatus Gribaldobacteria) CG_4_10_14_0_2_um_filter_33_15]PJB08812.1 MAG: ribonuclease J [bacterium (Candidatus Gribaldobacteria) CG_4_9_14_3_um_filter_33_9]
MEKISKQQNLRIIPLGGCEEVGRNMTVFEYGNDIVIIDMGIQFPEEDMPGIDYVIPNVEYLRGKEKRIRAVLFSHGHLDHIGAAPILLKKLDNPLIIARPLTIEMIKRHQEDFERGSSKKLRTMYIKNIQDKINLGNFQVGFFPVDHSIMDAVGIILETPLVSIVHPGDWVIKHKPIDKEEIKYTELSKLKRPIILMLESLGAINPKTPVTEEQMLNNLYKLISPAPGRTIITTFSSQILRIKQILEYASKIGKKVALDGFSMKLNMGIAEKLGYLKAETIKDTIIPTEKITDFPDNKIIIICTGGQGEEMSALPRIVSGNHRFIKIRKNDTVIFSSSVIPGNERTVQRLKDNTYRLSDYVFHTDIMDVHISGHSNIQDVKEIISQIKPDYFIPVYANHFMLKEAAKIAYGLGFPKERVLVPDNGSIIDVDTQSVKMLKEKVPSNYVMVDGLGVGDVGEIVLRDRQNLAQDGMFVIIAVVDRQTGKVKGSPDIISRGFVYLRESKELLKNVRKRTINIVDKAASSGGAVNWVYVKNELRDKIGKFLFLKTKRRPMVLPVVIEV